MTRYICARKTSFVLLFLPPCCPPKRGAVYKWGGCRWWVQAPWSALISKIAALRQCASRGQHSGRWKTLRVYTPLPCGGSATASSLPLPFRLMGRRSINRVFILFLAYKGSFCCSRLLRRKKRISLEKRLNDVLEAVCLPTHKALNGSAYAANCPESPSLSLRGRATV